jgi:site-specific recombinase XerD
VISIKLPKKALEIINRYHTKDEKKSDFIFPFLDKNDKLDDPAILHARITSITTYTNDDLKEIAKQAEIEKHIHFHTSRHTWATRALRKGMRIEYVSKLMGHSNIRTTQVYAKIVNEDLDKAMDIFDAEPTAKEEEGKEIKK